MAAATVVVLNVSIMEPETVVEPELSELLEEPSEVPPEALSLETSEVPPEELSPEPSELSKELSMEPSPASVCWLPYSGNV